MLGVCRLQDRLDQGTGDVPVTFSSTFVYGCIHTAFACESSMQSTQYVKLASPPIEAPMQRGHRMGTPGANFRLTSSVYLTVLYACSKASMLLLLKRIYFHSAVIW